jgi:phenylpropionate dioxygenase-like ring-hydroxylating dioxygenase large terminal subunit
MKKEENELLTCTDAGSPVGDLFRAFWMPALLSEEVAKPDGPPVRVRLLGEDLVAFRDSSGRVGLLDAYCPHRRAELYLGRNELNGIRCVYHGWKFATDGRCVDVPTDDCSDAQLRRLSAKAYPVQERGGIVWAYMGPGQPASDPPMMEFTRVPAEHRYVSKCLMRCNYLQALEGSIDYSHISFLHKEVDSDADVFGIGEMIRYSDRDGRPKLFAERTTYGLQIGARRDAGPDEYYWRVARWLLPCFVLVPTAPGNVSRANLFIPIDDKHCWWYRIRWHKERPLSAGELEGYRDGGFDYARLVAGTYVPQGARGNDYLQDRELQSHSSFTGIPSAQLQDLAIQESQGAVHDRSREKLMPSDMPIAQCRRILAEAATRMQQNGQLPPGASQPHLFGGYAYATTQPRSMGFDEVRAVSD